MVRKSVGQSHSAIMRQGYKLIAQSTIKFNIYRGVSSVTGSVIGAGTSIASNKLKSKYFRW